MINILILKIKCLVFNMDKGDINIMIKLMYTEHQLMDIKIMIYKISLIFKKVKSLLFCKMININTKENININIQTQIKSNMIIKNLTESIIDKEYSVIIEKKK